MKKKFTLILVTLAMVLVPVFAVQAAPVIYSAYGEMLAAFPGQVLVENFEDITLLPGLSVVSTYPNAIIENGVYKDIVGGPNNYVTTWTNSAGAGGFYAWGGWFDLAFPGGQGTNIAIWADGTFIGEIDKAFQGQFWGFSMGAPFSSVVMMEGSYPATQETYWTVDLAYVSVPEPTTMLLLGLGLLGLGVARRKK